MLPRTKSVCRILLIFQTSMNACQPRVPGMPHALIPQGPSSVDAHRDGAGSIVMPVSYFFLLRTSATDISAYGKLLCVRNRYQSRYWSAHFHISQNHAVFIILNSNEKVVISSCVLLPGHPKLANFPYCYPDIYLLDCIHWRLHSLMQIHCLGSSLICHQWIRYINLFGENNC